MKKLLILFMILGLCSPALAETDVAKSVEQILGQKGATQKDVVKFAFPRSDLKVKMGTVAVEPGLALVNFSRALWIFKKWRILVSLDLC